MENITHSNKKVVFMGGKQIGVDCLKVLVEKGIKPQLVVCNKDDKGEDFAWHQSLAKEARKYNIETIVGKKLTESDVFNAVLGISPEIIFCIGGTQIIPIELIKAGKLGCLNIHPAYLPKYRGRYSTVHALFNGEKETGVTLHWMDEGIDTGPIILQEKFPISETDTAKTLWDNFTKIGTKLFCEFVDLWLSGKEIVAVPQDEAQATYYPKGLPNDGKIDWSWDGEKIKRFIRALTFEPFPPADFEIGDKKMVIIDEKYFNGFDDPKKK